MASNEQLGVAVGSHYEAPSDNEEVVRDREALDRRLARVAEQAQALSKVSGVEIGPDGNVLVGKERDELIGVPVAPGEMYNIPKQPK